MCAFFTPKHDMLPGAIYTLFGSEAGSQPSGGEVPLSELRITTIAFSQQVNRVRPLESMPAKGTSTRARAAGRGSDQTTRTANTLNKSGAATS